MLWRLTCGDRSVELPGRQLAVGRAFQPAGGATGGWRAALGQPGHRVALGGQRIGARAEHGNGPPGVRVVCERRVLPMPVRPTAGAGAAAGERRDRVFDKLRDPLPDSQLHAASRPLRPVLARCRPRAVHSRILRRIRQVHPGALHWPAGTGTASFPRFVPACVC